MKPLAANRNSLVFSALFLSLSCALTWAQAAPSTAPTSPPAASSAAASQSGSDSKPTPGDAETSKQAYANVKTQHLDKDDKLPGGGLYEDWNTLKVPSDLKYEDPLPPTQLVPVDGITRELVQLTWRPWDIIDLYVMKPAGVKNPPVILYLYSFPTDTDRFKVEEFAKLATRNGFAAVGFLSAMTGQRFHDRPTKEWFVSELQEALVTSTHDVQLVLDYLDKRGDLDMSRVGIFADGSGGSIAILTASVDPRIKALDLFDPWGDWPDWMAHSRLIQIEDERKTYMQPEFLKKVANFDPVNYLPQLKTQAIRLQFLDTDGITTKTPRKHMEEAAPPQAKIVHYADGKEAVKAAGENGELFDWLKEQLVPALATQGSGLGHPTAAKKTPQQ